MIKFARFFTKVYKNASLIMKKVLISLLLFVVLGRPVQAQLADGTVAPDFTATDLNGVSHNLYDLLNQGKTVYIEFSATWCGICWNYHNTHALRNLWNTYGPPGTNEVYVLFIESYSRSNTACLYGSAGCNNSTKGNWVADTPYPIVDNAAIGDTYLVDGYPTIYCICPGDKKVFQTGTMSADGLWNFKTSTCIPPLQAQVAAVQAPLCPGANTGYIQLSVSGGVGAYTYAWSNGATTANLSDLLPGTYTCTVTDESGSTTEIVPVVLNNPVFGVAISEQQEVSCRGGSDGMVSVGVLGGNGALSYVWSNGATSPTLTGLTAGNYQVTVTDLTGCIQTTAAVVTQPAMALSATISSSPQTLNGVNNGSASVVAAGGTPGYSYFWTNGATASSISGLAPGNYAVTITDLHGCTAEQTTTVNPVNCLISASVVATNISCAGMQNGAASVILSGAPEPVSYTWSNGMITASASGLAPGVYTVVVVDASACSATGLATISEPPPFSNWTVQTADPLCPNINDGSVEVSINGSTPPYQYAWSTGNTGNAAANLGPGMYSVTATDQSGCQTSTSMVIAAAFDTEAPVLTCPDNIQVCPAQNVVEYTISATDNCSLEGWTLISGLPSGSTFPIGFTAQRIRATDVVGNSTDCLFMVEVLTPVVMVGQAIVNASNGQDNGSIDLTVAGGSGGYTWSWTNSAGQVVGSTEDLVGLPPGIYTPALVDGAGCQHIFPAIEIQAISSTNAPTYGTIALLYPNPVTHELHLSLSEMTPEEALLLVVLDMTGRELVRTHWSGVGVWTLDCTGWPAGVYWIRYGSGGSRFVVL